MIFRSNRTYLAWKDQPFPIFTSSIAIQEVEPDGFTFVRGTEPTTVLTASYFADRMVMEAPWIIYREPYYYMFHSTNTYLNPKYNIGVARSRNVLGPYDRWDTKTLSVSDECLKLSEVKNCTFVSPGASSWRS